MENRENLPHQEMDRKVEGAEREANKGKTTRRVGRVVARSR